MTEELNWQEDRYITFKRLTRIAQYDFLPPELMTKKYHFQQACVSALSMYDLAAYIKKIVVCRSKFVNVYYFNWILKINIIKINNIVQMISF